MSKLLRILVSSLALTGLPATGIAEQSWSERATPPAKFARPSTEEKAQDWSGFHMGVNAGAGLKTENRDSVVPPSLNVPR